jgi:hypothetical protein
MNEPQAPILHERGQSIVSRVRVTAPTAAIAMAARVPDFAGLEGLETHLMEEFGPPLRQEEVQRCLVACVTKYQSAAVQNYIPLLIEREARGQLRVLCEMHQ